MRGGMGKANIIFRHFAADDTGIDLLRKGTEQVKQLQDEGAQKGLSFGLKLSVDESRLSDDQIAECKGLVGELRGSYLFYEPENVGPGPGFLTVVYGPVGRFPPTIVGFADLDQFGIAEGETLERINVLVDKMKTDDILYGLGARSVPVRLGYTRRASDLRAIHENVHTIALGEYGTPLDMSVEGVSRPFQKLGESTSGFSLMNKGHGKFSSLHDAMMSAAASQSPRLFLPDYFSALMSAELGEKVFGMYVPTRENHFSPREEGAEVAGVERFIRTHTQQLAGTPVRLRIKHALDKGTEQLVRLGYCADDVSMVYSVMQEAFH